MLNNNNNMTSNEQEDGLAAIKQEIQRKITAKSLQINQSKKKLRDLEKLQIETIPDKPQRIQQQLDEIASLNEQLIELQTDLSNLNKTKQEEKEEEINGALNAVRAYIDKNPSLAYLIDEEMFVQAINYSSVPEKLNVQMKKFKPTSFSEYLGNELKEKIWNLPPLRVKDLFNTSKRTFTMSRYSIDPLRWDSDRVYLPIEHMRQYFIDNMQLTAEQEAEAALSLKFFDWLMYSLSGNKQENKDHIEKWILHKIINYKKATTTPDIVIVGHVGGNGKGVLQAIIRLMLPSELSGKANSKTLNGNFNAIMLGKLIVFFDDQNSKEIPLDVVKELAGSDTMIFEPKGKDQYEGEKTHSSAWFSQVPPFKLTPSGQEGGVDRRFSIMATNITFLESIRKHVQEETGQEVTVDESKDRAEVIVGKHLLNRVNIAYWFKHLQAKHPEVNESYALKPLHGADYHYFLEQQESTIESIFKRLITPQVNAFNCVPLFVVKELFELAEGEGEGKKKWKEQQVKKEIIALAAQYKVDIVFDRERFSIVNPDGTKVKRQLYVWRNAKQRSNLSFDWSLVSSRNYVEHLGLGQYSHITEDNVVFRFNNFKTADDSDDFDSDELPESSVSDNEIHDEDTNVKNVVALRSFLKPPL